MNNIAKQVFTSKSKKKLGANRRRIELAYDTTFNQKDIPIMTEDYKYVSVRLDTTFINFIESQTKKLQVYVNFGKTSSQDLCMYEAKLRLCLRLIEIAEYNEKLLCGRIRGIDF